jgi:RNase H-fold protein (predicted Holliday junction resolvase)
MRRRIRLRDGTIRELRDHEYLIPEGATLLEKTVHVPVMLRDEALKTEQARADLAHAEMVRSITMASRHVSDREQPSEDREQAYEAMRQAISNAWQQPPL